MIISDVNKYAEYALTYLGKNIPDYGVVHAVTVYDESHLFYSRVAFCFREQDGSWSEDSVVNCFKFDTTQDDYVIVNN